MVLLSPPKLLMVLVIALIVLGPDKLPSMARRVGAAWSEFSRWRAHLESEVRASFPGLPATTEITKVVRSPLSLLDRLADEHDRATLPPTVGAAPGVSGDEPSPVGTSLVGTARGPGRTAPPPGGPGSSPSARSTPIDGPGGRRRPGAELEEGPDVSSMN